MDHRNREKLVDVCERRAVAEPFEFRQDKATGQYILEGYAATWDPYDCYGGPERGGWVENLTRAAFQRTLGSSPDVMLLINHEGLPLARTTTETLHLSTDNHGLLMRAQLDPSDPDVQRLAPKMKPQANGKSNMDEMSFSFRVKDQKWDANYTNRQITELSLQKGDVSVVNYGMNPNTQAVLSTEAVGALARADNSEQLELRKLDRTTLGRAMLTLERAWRSGPAPEDERATSTLPGGKLGGDDEGDDKDKNEDDDKRANGGRTGTWVNFDGSHLLFDGTCITCANDRAKTPKEYSDVANFADPGYLGPDGKQAHDGNGVKRYPIDAAHVKAAWSYINMPKNQKGYTAEQLSAIKGKIKAAMKKAGHDVSDEKALRQDAADCTCPDDDCPVHGGGDDHSGELYRVEAVRNANGGISMVAITNDGRRTPLPSFQQSGQLVGTSTGGMFRAGPGGGAIPQRYIRADAGASNIIGGAQAPYTYDPPDDLQTQDTHDLPYTKDTSEVSNITTSAHTHEVAAPDAGGQPRGLMDGDEGIDHNPDDTVDDMHDAETSPAMDDDDEISLSVDDRLRSLRHVAELPDLPRVDEALSYIRHFAHQ